MSVTRSYVIPVQQVRRLSGGTYVEISQHQLVRTACWCYGVPVLTLLGASAISQWLGLQDVWCGVAGLCSMLLAQLGTAHFDMTH